MRPLLALGLAIFRTKFMLGVVFYAAVAAHALEAIYAYLVALDMGCRSTLWLWVVQTFIFGGPSLTILTARRAKYRTGSQGM